jgi:uncharacterized protein (TIGR02246 family)
MSIAALKQPKTEDYEITITRIVDAAPDQVFAAWLDPEHLSRWWGPRDGRRDFSTPYVEVDPKPGGIFRTCIRSPHGDDYWARGVFTEIDAPRRLAFTHGWENERGEVEHERPVTVELTDAGGKTQVAFRISGYDSIESYTSEVEGWNECLDRLVRYFAEGRQISASEDEAEIRALIDRWSQALEAKDLDGLTAGYAPDILLFDVKPPYQVSGLEAYRAVWEECLPYFPAEFQSERHELKIEVSGDLAFARCLHRIKPVGEDHPAGHTWLRVTVCYRRFDGRWRVVHEHVSIPFDPESGKAVFTEHVP